MKILVVDDSSTLRILLVKLINLCGYSEVSAAPSAEDAIVLLNDTKFDCIFLDWNLPKMSGIDFLKYLRENTLTSNIKVVMVTTIQEKSNILRALKIGLQGYLIKPVTKEMIASKLEELSKPTS